MLISGRAWAAAAEAEGNLDLFLSRIGLISPSLSPFWQERLPALIKQTDHLRHQQSKATDQWYETAFGQSGDLLEAEQIRRRHSHLYWMQRWKYKKFAHHHRLPAVRLEPGGKFRFRRGDCEIERWRRGDLFSTHDKDEHTHKPYDPAFR